VKYKLFALIVLSVSIAMIVTAFGPAASASPRLSGATQTATLTSPTSQCDLIDALVVANAATPGATQVATRTAPTTQATLVPTVVLNRYARQRLVRSPSFSARVYSA
jgi:hypothetical protein